MAQGGGASSVTTRDDVTRVPPSNDRERYLAALTIAIQDKESQRTEMNKQFNSELKNLKKEARDVANELKSGVQYDLFTDQIATVARGPKVGNGGEESTH